LQKWPFFGYAAGYWGHHAHGPAEAVIKDMALAFLQDNTRVASTRRFLSISPYFWDTFRDESHQDPLSGVVVASFFGLEKILCYQFKNGANAGTRGAGGWTPLSIAVNEGHKTVVELLLM